MDVWRDPTLGRIAGATDQQHAAVNFLAPLDSRTLLYVARAEDWSGPWLWALDVERKVTRRVLGGLDQYTSVSASRDGRRIVATVANPSASLWRVPLLDRSRRRSRRAVHRCRCRRGGRWRRASAGPRCSICPPAGRATDSGGSRTDRRRKSGGARTGRCPSRPPCRRTDSRVAIVVRQRGETAPVDHVGGRHERTDVGPVHRNRRSGRPGHRGLVAGRAWIVTGGRDAQGPGSVQDPGGMAVRPAARRRCSVNPVWSPNGNLIVYAGRSRRRPGRAPWQCDRMEPAVGSAATCWSARAAIASCPTERLGVLAAHSMRWTSGCFDFATKNPASSSRTSAIRARYGRSTSHLTGNPSCSTARGRTRISS